MHSKHATTNLEEIVKLIFGTLIAVSGVLLPLKGEGGEYYPLEQGRSWTYSVTKFDAQDTKQVSEFSRRTKPMRTLDGRQVVPLEYSKDGRITGWVYVIEDDTGTLWYARQGAKQSTPTPFGKYAIRYPIGIGASWSDSMRTFLLPVDEEVPYTMTIVVLADSVTVPAGRFENCLRVRLQGKKKIEGGLYWGGTVSLDATDWYCAGVGFVKSVLEQRIDHFLIDLRATKAEELVSYVK